jgi:hypothetical protein
MGISATNFQLDPNLARAAPIPAECYTDPGYSKLEQQKVFRPWNNLQDSMAFGDETQREEIEICEYVWRNRQAGVYLQGRYAVKRENGLHHFHQLLQEFYT